MSAALKSDELLLLAGLGIGGYLLYRMVADTGQAVSAGANAVANPIANLISWATLPRSMPLTGSVVLSTGAEVPLSVLSGISVVTGQFDANGNPIVQFNYQGQRWQFTGAADETGTYYAFPVSTGIGGYLWDQ